MDKDFPEDISELPVRLYKLVSGESIIAYTHNLDDESNGALDWYRRTDEGTC